MKPPLGASHGPQDNNAGSQANSRPARLFFPHIYGLGLPSAIEANIGHQTKQFMTQSKFDLGPPEMPLPSGNADSGGWHCVRTLHRSTGVLIKVAAHDRSCWTCSNLTANFRIKASIWGIIVLSYAWSRDWVYFYCLNSNISLQFFFFLVTDTKKWPAQL